MVAVIVQLFGILGMAMNILSYQGKSQRSIMTMQFFGSVFFAVNLFMLNAMSGCLLNIVGIARAIVYANKDKIKRIKIFNVGFVVLYLLSYVMVFTVFKKEFNLFNGIIEFLPIIAMTCTTISFSSAKPKIIRRMMFISSPFWLTYNSINMSIGGILCEIFSIISAFIGVFRYDLKKKEEK